MIKFVLFIKRVYVLLIFIVLEVVVLNYYSNSTSYTKAKLLTLSNQILGGVYGSMSDVNEYFSLRKQNNNLVQEIIQLRSRLEHYRGGGDEGMDSIYPKAVISPYLWSSARVDNNSITHQENFITLNKGKVDGIESNMAVVSIDGTLVGNVLRCSDNFSVCISVLNTSFRASGKIKNSESFGPIFWDGKDHQYVTLTDIPKYTQITPGDTVVTTDYSAIFPPDLLIGTVVSYKMNESMLYDVKVKLAAQLSSLKQVLLIKYTDAAERVALENDVIGDVH